MSNFWLIFSQAVKLYLYGLLTFNTKKDELIAAWNVYLWTYDMETRLNKNYLNFLYLLFSIFQNRHNLQLSS